VSRFEPLDKFMSLLDWQNLGKSCFVASVGIALGLFFAIWIIVTLPFTRFGEVYLDPGFAKALLTLHLSASAFWAMVLLLGLHLHRRNLNPDWYSVLVMVAYPVLLVPSAWIYGWITLPAGLVLVGSVQVAMVLFEMRLARISVAIGALLLSVMIGLTIWGVLPYAPLFAIHPLSADKVDPYYLVSELVLALPFFVIGTLIELVLILRWREREDTAVKLSITDELTGVANRRSIMSTLHLELARSERSGSALTVAILDLDNFKNINDTYGHDAGDCVLREVTRRLQGSIRKVDSIGRFGGEEFMLVLTDTSSDSAIRALDRCRKAISAVSIQTAEQAALDVTASFGFCTGHADGSDDARTLLMRADAALYHAKASGRNCITEWSPGISSGGPNSEATMEVLREKK